MTLMRRSQNTWDPFQELENLQNEMSRLFDVSLSRQGDKSSQFPQIGWTPAIDIHDTKDQLVVKADLPGLKKEDVQVSIEDDHLIIKGEKKQETEKKENGYVRSERVYGSFYRAIALPASVNNEKVKATYKDGVLELKLTKKEEAKPKQINVDVE